MVSPIVYHDPLPTGTTRSSQPLDPLLLHLPLRPRVPPIRRLLGRSLHRIRQLQLGHRVHKHLAVVRDGFHHELPLLTTS